ncbi:ssDNA-binding protein [Bifidobacterium thermophilum]|uniref:ssDNA-binding protein n=1 Tax=Bifidobacterium thermophilum TaxID=33905 RepID=UPI000C71552B|nr:ssDNA-binding protein [Bifidobacterium thermophilum]PKU90125.1 hypothetical protein CQR48_0979 [Bifidobacterium thermophilum]
MADDKKKFITVPVMLRNVRLVQTFNLFEPDSGSKYSDDKYHLNLLVSKDDKENIDAINTALKQVTAEAIKAGELPQEQTIEFVRKAITDGSTDEFPSPLHDGDKDKNADKYTYLKGNWLVRASSKNPVRFYDRHAEQIEDVPAAKREFYPGAVVNAKITLMAFGASRVASNGGVTVWASGIQKAADGERLGGASDGFTDLGSDNADGFAPAGATADPYAAMGM